MKIKMIAAISQNNVIGKDNKIPWNYSEDMKFFRKMTSGCTVICGRSTYESFGARPLPKRVNIIITSNSPQKYIGTGVKVATSLKEGINQADMASDVWLIGGSNIYREGMEYADEIYLTLIPEAVEGDNLVHFPTIDSSKFQMVELIPIENSELKVAKYVRI